MASFKRVSLLMMTTMACGALAACDGANDIASPGTGGNVIINNPPAPTPTPTPTPTSTLVTAATGCPTIADPKGLTDNGVITGPTGSWRVCTLPSIIAKSVQLPKVAGLVYEMRGRVDVGCDSGFTAPTAGAPLTSTTVGCTAANGFTLTGGQLTADTNVTLTIDPGVIVFGGTGTSWLAVNRGNKIAANGTATAPVVFTSRDNILGLNTDASFGQWGGVVLLGRAKVTDCNYGSTAAGTCERDTEGAADKAIFGGADDTYNAGSMKYVQIRYSGYVLGADKELQALTTEGVGSGTTLEYIQSHNSSDDGAEFFGGTVRFKHYIATGADDDSLDIDTGLQGFFQYVLLLQRPGQGDALMEIDSNGLETDLPRQKTAVVNFTAVQSQVSSNNEANDLGSLLLRGNSDTSLVNGIIVSPNNECLRLNGSGATPATLFARAVVMQCNATKYLGSGSYTAAQAATAFGSGSNANNDAYTPSLTSLFINGATETAVTAFDAKTLNTFFDTTTYIGAVKDANDSWYKGWTCNSSYAPFDTTTSTSRSCTSIPTN
ncbi:hypothetical protein P6144_01485 [Sphingomonas sp. HITSZ_GF]|uniref:hypothetical protein n=1 Tax=Sphingomonas sp. HITSZ_GF TaxID=3037247 RepID=UPI00240DD444|nr:hypothetical protein [Sphingomonas sp. HITSZ_GF]MDG2532306.1 hypothetical protein [Sphingomonas sp. HITSZ_GF]